MMETLDEKCKIIIIIKQQNSLNSLTPVCAYIARDSRGKKKKGLWAFPIDICFVMCVRERQTKIIVYLYSLLTLP